MDFNRGGEVKKISSIISVGSKGFPIRGVDGYGGEQDGTKVCLSDIYRFASRETADQKFPNGVPDYVELHWGCFHPGHGWEVVFGWWDNEPEEGDGNPLTEGI